MIVLDETPVVDTTSYAAGDALTDKSSLAVTGQHGFLERVKLTDKSGQNGSLKLYVFKRDITVAAKNAAFTIAAADSLDLVAELDLDNWVTPLGSSFSYCALQGLKLPLQLDEVNNAYTLYYQLATQNSITFGNADDLVLELTLLSSGDL